MTTPEAERLQGVADRLGRTLVIRPHPDAGFVEMRADPCVFLEEHGQTTRCAAYADRPTNCRRFACFRANPQTEPLEPGGPLMSANLRERWHDARTRHDFRRLQRQAEGWARDHGWVVR